MCGDGMEDILATLCLSAQSGRHVILGRRQETVCGHICTHYCSKFVSLAPASFLLDHRRCLPMHLRNTSNAQIALNLGHLNQLIMMMQFITV